MKEINSNANNIANDIQNIKYTLPEQLIKSYTKEINNYDNKRVIKNEKGLNDLNLKNKKGNKGKSEKNEKKEIKKTTKNFIGYDTGKVTWFNEKKGIGFITSNKNKNIKYFFNADDVKDIFYVRIIDQGFNLRFKFKKDKKGLRAYDIYVIKNETNTVSYEQNKETGKIQCQHCGKLIVPRVITYYGEPVKSVCPFCGKTIKKFDGCFIATAVYKNVNCHELKVLRQFRDEKLKATKLGTLFIKYYYKLSPPIAKWLKKHPYISYIVKYFLNWIVKIIEKKDINKRV